MKQKTTTTTEDVLEYIRFAEEEDKARTSKVELTYRDGRSLTVNVPTRESATAEINRMCSAYDISIIGHKVANVGRTRYIIIQLEDK